MAFPKNPTAGQEVTIEGVTYAWNPIEDSWERFSEPAHALEWEAGRTYLAIGEMVHRQGLMYRSIAESTGFDPAIAQYKTHWQRISTRIFAQRDDPTSSQGGQWEVIEGDKWIDTDSMPTNAIYKEGNMVFTWVNSSWKQLSGTRVIKDGDPYTTYNKVTELIIVEESIHDSNVDKAAAKLAFIGRDNGWHTMRLWNHPWGLVGEHRASSTYSGDVYSANFISITVPLKYYRRYKVSVQVSVYMSGSDANYQTMGASNIGAITCYMKSGQNVVMKNEGQFRYTSPSANVTLTGYLGTVSHSFQYASGVIMVEDVGPA
jgi:hypothetical protein